MAGSVNQATGLPDFEDVLRTGAHVGQDFQPACVRTSEGNCGLETRGNPSPNFGDGAGMGTTFSKNSGTVRGGDYLKTLGRGSRCPRKSPNFGDGV